MKNDRHAMVDRVCERCGTPFQARKERVDAGKGRFCSLACFNEYQKETDVLSSIGKENAKKAFDKKAKKWTVYWHDEDRTRHNTSYARWWWEINKGEIPAGYRASYKDGNPENIDPENIILISKEEFGNVVSKRLMGHTTSDEAKKKMSEKKKGKPKSEANRKAISASLYKRWENGGFDLIHKGEHSKRWRGGQKPIYPEEFNNDLRKFVKQRDKYSCRVCKIRVTLHVHHIDADKFNNELDNLITLCRSCHMKVHTHSIKDNDPLIMSLSSMLK